MNVAEPRCAHASAPGHSVPNSVAGVVLAAGLIAATATAALAGAFPAEFDLSTLDGSNGFSIAGTLEGDSDGISVSSAGDVNGDGIADIIVGGFGAHVIFGTAQGFPTNLPLSALDGTNGFALAWAGFSVSGAGDVNGDGIDDIVLGGQLRHSYVVFGTDQGFPAVFDISALDGSNGFAVNAFSSSVSGAGDVNGDGFADIVIGDYLYGQDLPYPDYDTLGRAYVVFGSDRGYPALVDAAALNGTNGFAFEGIPGTLGSVGYSVSGAGDLNGDGNDDIIVASMQPAFDLEEFYVLFGTTQGFPAVIHPADLNGANGFAMFTSVDELMYWASDAGDVNGDGIDDVIVGQPYFRESWESLPVGRSYVLFGARTPFPARLDLSALDGTNGFALTGVADWDYSGFGVSGAGDVNGDGIGDVIVGASGVDVNGVVDAGRSYVVFGSDNGFPPEMPLSALDGTNGFALNGVNAGDQSGYSVSDAGDLNGDGVDDLIIGAPHTVDLPGEPGIGQAYVMFGRRMPGLSVSGACPGTVTVDVTRASPGGAVALVTGTAEGSAVVASGACAGAVLDLENPALYTTLTADADGAAGGAATLPTPACSIFLQAVDAATCVPSNVAQVP